MNLTKASTISILFQLLFVSANGQNLKATAAAAKSKSKSGKQEQEYSCREDFYTFKYDEWERTPTDNGYTIRNYVPIYGFIYDDEGVGVPDFTKIIGEYNSVDSIIPRGSQPTPEGDSNGSYTCQQQAIIGFNSDSTFYFNQITGTGICSSAGPGNIINEGNMAVTGGMGIHEGASGIMLFLCANMLGYCNILVEVCGPNVEPIEM